MSQADEPLASRIVPAKTSLRRSHVLNVLGIALGLRLLVLWVVIARYPPQWLFTRGMEMGLLAKSLLAGEGLSSPFGGHTGPTAFIAPVYPVFVAAVFKVFGSYSLASAVAIIIIQIGLNLLTIWLIMCIANRLFNQSAATVAGLIWACSLPLIWMPTILWETSLSSFLLAGLVAGILRLREQSQVTRSQWLIFGAYCGFSALVNPALLLSVIAIAAWLVYQLRKTATYKPLLALLAALLVFSPWPIRNAIAFHAFVPLRTTVGFELWMGNRPNATGYLDESLFPMFNQIELADYNTRGEIGYSHHKSQLATQFIQQHPATFLQLTAIRAIRFWTGSGTQNGSIFFAIHAIFTSLTGMAGLIFLIKSRRVAIALVFALPLLLFPLPYLITHAEFRYRIVIDCLLTVLSGLAITEFYRILVPSASHAPGMRTRRSDPVALPAQAAVWKQL